MFQVIAFSESRVTTVMAVGEELWVGLGNGQVLIFDVTRNDAYEDEAYVVLNENKGENLFYIQLEAYPHITYIIIIYLSRYLFIDIFIACFSFIR